MGRRIVPAFVVALLLASTVGLSALAAFNPGTPGSDPRDHRPNDPGYAPYEGQKFPNCPLGAPSIFDEQFGWFSYAPLGPACEGNMQVSGVSLDTAWQLGLGRPDVVIAQVDTGINWADKDLRRQVHLNWAELPPPELANGTSACAGVNLATYSVRGPAPPCYANGQTYGSNPPKPFFNVDSYAADPRVTDYNEVPGRPLGENSDPTKDADGGKINAADLIHTFSTWCNAGPGGAWIGDAAKCAGFDNDGNGYAHDIAGWNFYDDNNDPYDLNSYTSADDHGTGRAEDAVAEANNGIGGVGSCPYCTYMPLRLHSFFINDVNGYGAAATYAVDNGASVLELAFASANNTPFARAATAYAVAHNVVPVSITQDLNTPDHLYPENYPDVFTVNGCLPDSDGLGSNGQALEPHTYFRSSNLTAPGDHLDACMSGAVTGSVASAQTSGIVGLLIAHSRDLADAGWLSSPLTALEAEQVLERTTDPVTALEALGDCPCPPSLPLPPYSAPDPPAPGDAQPRALSAQVDGAWSAAFGYGRMNALKALQALGSPANFATPTGNNAPALPAHIPPEVSLTSPDWWDQVDPTTTSQLPLVGYAAHNRCPGPATISVDAAPGAEPATSQYQRLLSQPMSAASESGTLATLSVASLPVAQSSGAPANREAFTVTLRLGVDDACHNHAETRRVVHVHHEDGIVAGFPLDYHSGVFAGVHNTDLRGDGNLESVVADDAGEVHVLDANGHDVPWFNGGHPFLSRGSGYLTHPTAPAFVSGTLPSPHSSFVGTPAVGDLFGDGRQEIVAVDLDGRVYAIDSTGALLPGFPVTPDPALVPVSNESKQNHQQRGVSASPALGHLDDANPDQLDIVVAALDQRVYVWRPDGGFLPTFNGGHPVQLVDTSVPTAQREYAQITATPAVAPLLGDGHDQVIVPTTEFYNASSPDLNSLKSTITSSLQPSGLGTLVDSAVIGVLSQASGASGRTYAVDRFGKLLPGWPVSVTGIVPNLLDPVATVPPVVGDFGNGPRAVLSLLSAPTEVFKPDGTLDEGLAMQQGPAATTTDHGISLDVLGHASIGKLSPTGPGIVEGGLTANAVVNLLLVGQNLPFDHELSAWDPTTAQMYPTYPRPLEDYQAETEALVAGLGDPAGNSAISSSGMYVVHAYDVLGQEAPGFPKFTGGWSAAAPALADLTGTGKLDLLLGTREGWLYEWQVGGDPCASNEWWANHHDEWNSGAYGKVTRPPGAITTFGLTGGTASATASWTWSGAQFRCGTASSAQVRVSSAPITPQNFAAATLAAQLTPGAPGTSGSQSISGAGARCLYVALQVRNSAGLRSPLAEAVLGSGCALASQPGITPVAAVTPNTSAGGGPGGLGLAALLVSMLGVSLRRALRRRGPAQSV